MPVKDFGSVIIEFKKGSNGRGLRPGFPILIGSVALVALLCEPGTKQFRFNRGDVLDQLESRAPCSVC